MLPTVGTRLGTKMAHSVRLAKMKGEVLCASSLSVTLALALAPAAHGVANLIRQKTL